MKKVKLNKKKLAWSRLMGRTMAINYFADWDNKEFTCDMDAVINLSVRFTKHQINMQWPWSAEGFPDQAYIKAAEKSARRKGLAEKKKRLNK